MLHLRSCLKQALFVWILCLATLVVYADTLIITPTQVRFEKQPLQPYLFAWEDKSGEALPGDLIHRNSLFAPLALFQYQNPSGTYWLKMTFTNANAFQPAAVISFSNLTHVEAYLYQNHKLITHKKAGAFRPISQIRQEDSRFHITLPLVTKQTYTLLLRVHHAKGYQPYFDFSIQERGAFMEGARKRDQAAAWAQGAIAVFLIYTLLSWLVSHFRPYLWLALFIAGVGMYGLCSGRYFIDWFFPEQPLTGWLFNLPALHLGLLGFYLLVVDFWQLPKYNPGIYRFGKLCLGVLAAVSVSGFCINYFTGNFKLTNTINLWAFVFPFSFIIALLVRCFRRLDRAQKYLYYGIGLFVAAGLFITLSSAFLQEQSLHFAPYVSSFTALAVFLLFSTGLKEALRQHERDKLIALEQLTNLQKQQNTLLENNVAARTKELIATNNLLQVQTDLLMQRNATIETLINELSHRVKNNLQLLYSLSSLQLPQVADEATGHILKGNMARIKAMMVVNQKLDYVEETNQVSLASLITELTCHLQDIYDRPKRVKVKHSIPEDMKLPSQQVLSLGLILTELITNSFKYAFRDSTHPEIIITVRRSASSHLKLVYADNGNGIPATKKADTLSLGLSLVHDLTRQLNGTFTTNGENGLSYTFKIPEWTPKDLKREKVSL